MNVKWVLLDGAIVKRAGSSLTPPPGATVVTTPMRLQDLARAHLVNGSFEIRPNSPDVTGNGPFSVGPCAAGTEIEVDDIGGGETLLVHTVTADDTAETIDLPDSGAYRIEVRAPLPALPTVREVEIT